MGRVGLLGEQSLSQADAAQLAALDVHSSGAELRGGDGINAIGIWPAGVSDGPGRFLQKLVRFLTWIQPDANQGGLGLS